MATRSVRLYLSARASARGARLVAALFGLSLVAVRGREAPQAYLALLGAETPAAVGPLFLGMAVVLLGLLVVGHARSSVATLRWLLLATLSPQATPVSRRRDRAAGGTPSRVSGGPSSISRLATALRQRRQNWLRQSGRNLESGDQKIEPPPTDEHIT